MAGHNGKGDDGMQSIRDARMLIMSADRVEQAELTVSGGLASMGAAAPYAIAAKIAHPDHPVVALVGDGAMQVNDMAGLITVAKYWREWTNPKWVVCAFNNQDLNQMTWEPRVMEGAPKFEATRRILDVPYHQTKFPYSEQKADFPVVRNRRESGLIPTDQATPPWNRH